MKMLLLDTAAEPAQVALVESGQLGEVAEITDKRQLSELLLAQIDRLLQEARWQLGDLNGIGVVTGPGSFTALRIGVATANALAFSHGLPVVGLPAGQASVAEQAKAAARRLAAGEGQSQVLPDYGREPSITPPKSEK